MLIMSTKFTEIIDWNSRYICPAPYSKLTVSMLSDDIGMYAPARNLKMFT